MTATIFSSKNNQWRESYNPLRGLTISRVVAMLDAGKRGQYSDLQWFYYFMERSDPVIFTVLQRRRAALMECDWDVRRVAPQVDGGMWLAMKEFPRRRDAKNPPRLGLRPPPSGGDLSGLQLSAGVAPACRFVIVRQPALSPRAIASVRRRVGCLECPLVLLRT
jgi:hypothetical protein